MIAATPAKCADEVFDGTSGVGLTDRLRVRAAISRRRWRCLQPRARRLDATWGDKPKDDIVLRAGTVARLDAGLGRKEEAIREALRAVDLTPIAKDSLNGPSWVANLALVYAWTGERDRALEQLEIVATIPDWPDIRRSPVQSVLG